MAAVIASNFTGLRVPCPALGVFCKSLDSLMGKLVSE